MTEFLYRFRPLNRLLDKGELDNQEIYFAEPRQLNDSMEGFRDIFWKGDSIIWKNLYRHYLFCLDCAYTQFALVGEEEPLTWDRVPLFSDGKINQGIPREEAENIICSRFFAEPGIIKLIELLSLRNFPSVGMN